MKPTIRFTGEQHQRLHAHLFGGGHGDQDERCAFAYATVESIGDRRLVLVRELRLVKDKQFVYVSHNGFQLAHDVMVEAVLHARRTGLTLIEIHSHPHPVCDDNTTFSRVDHDGQREFQRYLAWKHPADWLALVYGKGCVDGLYWSAHADAGIQVDAISVDARKLNLTPQGIVAQQIIDRGSYDRQLLAYGEDGQRRLAMTRLGIVGCGGLGSMIAMQAVLLGFRQFVLVDDKVVNANNRNRLPHVGAEDVGRSKAEAMAEYILAISPDAKIQIINASLRTKEAMNTLCECDLIAGGVDNDGARVVLSHLTSAYLIPYVDAASDVQPMKPVVAGGRVHVWRPGGNCLACEGLVDSDEANAILSTDNERDTRDKLGYGGARKMPSPSVVHVNGHVAASAAQELHALIGGHATVHVHRHHRADRGTEIVIPPRPRAAYCPCCQESLGIGRNAHLERFFIPDAARKANSDN